MEKNQKHLNKGALKEIAVIQNSTIIDSTIYLYLTTSYISSGRHDENRVSIVPNKKVKKIYLNIHAFVDPNVNGYAKGSTEFKVDDEYIINIAANDTVYSKDYNNLLKTKNGIGKVDIYTNSISTSGRDIAKIEIKDLIVYV